MGGGTTALICLFCHAKGEFGIKSPSQTYIVHLVTEHKILHDIDHVLERTVTVHRKNNRAVVDISAPNVTTIKEEVMDPIVPSVMQQPNRSIMPTLSTVSVPTMMQQPQQNRPIMPTLPMMPVMMKSGNPSVSSQMMCRGASGPPIAIRTSSGSFMHIRPSSGPLMHIRPTSGPSRPPAAVLELVRQKALPIPMTASTSTNSNSASSILPNEAGLSRRDTVVKVIRPNHAAAPTQRCASVHQKQGGAPQTFEVGSHFLLNDEDQADDDPLRLPPSLHKTARSNVQMYAEEGEDDEESSDIDDPGLPGETKAGRRKGGKKVKMLNEASPGNDEDASSESSEEEPVSSASEQLQLEAFRWAALSNPYQCKICNLRFDSSGHIRKHIKNKHALDKAVYVAQHGSFRIKASWMNCHECGKVLLHDRKLLKRHIVKEHGMNFVSYYVKHIMTPMRQLKKMDPRKPEPEKKTNYNVNAGGSKEQHQKRLDSTEVLFGEKFRLQCLVCSEWFKEFDLVVDHLKQKHGLVSNANTKVSYTVDELKAWANQIDFSCNMCPQHFQYERLLKAHIPSAHSVQMRQYVEKYGPIRKSDLPHCCMLCNTTMKHELIYIKHHVVTQHSLNIDEYYRSVLMRKLMEQHEDLQQYLNCYKYRCTICTKVHLSLTTLTEHVWLKHTLRPDGYKEKYGTYVTDHLAYECFKCNQGKHYKEPEFDKHLADEHDMSLQDYHGQYLQCAMQLKQRVTVNVDRVKEEPREETVMEDVKIEVPDFDFFEMQ